MILTLLVLFCFIMAARIRFRKLNLEDDKKEINAVIKEFNRIGIGKVLSSIRHLHPFEEYIIRYFYEGISTNE